MGQVGASRDADKQALAYIPVGNECTFTYEISDLRKQNPGLGLLSVRMDSGAPLPAGTECSVENLKFQEGCSDVVEANDGALALRCPLPEGSAQFTLSCRSPGPALSGYIDLTESTCTGRHNLCGQ